MATAIEFNHVGKQYRLGLVSTGTISHDLNRWWQTAILRKEDPYLKIGSVNDRTMKADSDYVWALRDIDFKVEQGDVVGIIGKNGAGKSTLLKLLSKVTGPTVGSIRARGRIASLLEVGTGFHGEMTGRENIYLNGAILGMTKQEISAKLDEIVDFSGCERYLDTPVKRYSSGMTVRLGFAVAAFLDPEILVVDEVLAVGDAEFQKKAIGKMQDVSHGEGRTVLFVSHNMASIRNLCKTGVLLENGGVKRIGEIEDVVNLYLEDNKIDIGDVSFLNKFTRLVKVQKEIEIIEIQRISEYLIDACSPIHYKMRVKRNININTFKITTLLTDTQRVERAGIAYSDLIEWTDTSKNEMELEVVIENHNLSQGKYTLDIWTHYGDVFSNYNYYDAVYRTITFEIERINGKIISEWHDYWGYTCLKQKVSINN